MLVLCLSSLKHRLFRNCEPVLPFMSRRVSKSCSRHLHKEAKDKVIFSGIQPTGVPHLGNYLGAIQQWVDLQNSAQAGTKLFFSIVDLHAITVPQERLLLKKWKRETTAMLIATGLDPDRSTIFYQSSVPAHTELMWILSCTASIGYLSRMTQWKNKLQLAPDASPMNARSKSILKLGLFSYPVLQAADILVHRATHVPVGDDQSQHLEFARECVKNFNNAYGGYLNPPATIISTAKRVMSLQEPCLKMSKSHKDSQSRVLLTDTPEEISKKIMAALTDSMNFVSYDPELRPGVSNLLLLLSYFSVPRRSPEELARAYINLSLRDFKVLVSDTISTGLEDIRERYHEIVSEDGGRYLDHVEAKGAERAQVNAAETMAIVKEVVGI